MKRHEESGGDVLPILSRVGYPTSSSNLFHYVHCRGFVHSPCITSLLQPRIISNWGNEVRVGVLTGGLVYVGNARSVDVDKVATSGNGGGASEEKDGSSRVIRVPYVPRDPGAAQRGEVGEEINF